jgi:hypothetical protein
MRTITTTSNRATRITAIAIAAGLAATAQADVFQRALGNADREAAYSISQTDDGGYITTGFRDPGPASSPAEDVLITKHFADGTIEWQRLWAGPGRDIGYSVQQTFDGGYIVAAESTSSGDPAVETLLIRLDPAGNLVWNNYYFGSFQGDPIHSVHPGVALDQGFNGQVYVTGNIFGRPMVLNVGPGGVPIWNATYADPLPPSFAARFAFTDIKHDPTNGTLVVSGTTLRNEPTPPFGNVLETQDAFLLRLDGAGSPLWIWNYDFPFDLDPTDEPGDNVRETGDGVDIDPTGRIILNGRTDYGASATTTGSHLVAVDPAGFPTWSREYRYFDPSGIVANVAPAYAAVRFDNNGDIIQAGSNRSFGGFTSAVEWKTNFGGSPAWFFAYGLPNNSLGHSVVPDASCGYAMAGQITFPPPAPPFARGETLLVKNDDDGMTGCAEVAWQFGPDFNAVPKQNGVIPDYVMKVMTAPNFLTIANSFDNALCYDPGCGACPCDINADGVLDLSDVSAFVACFTGALPCGDIAPPFGVWDISDINLFITCFLGGC